MTKNVLLIGRKLQIIEDTQQQLRIPNVRLLGATNIEDMRKAFAQMHIDHVILGAGIDLEIRLEMIREIFLSSEATTVHMNSRARGPEGFLPFVRSVLDGLL